jgi:lactate dehydrogenase-like 2-hydroxyacid dehydrogenase
VDEGALASALRDKRIAGAATDVYAKEPAGKENVLVRAAAEEGVKGRLILSPHVAWYAKSSIKKLQTVMGERGTYERCGVESMGSNGIYVH